MAQRKLPGAAETPDVEARIRQISQAGGDLRMAARGAMRDLLLDTREVSGEAVDVIAQTSAAIVRTTAAVKGDVAAAARAVLEGAIQGAATAGVDQEEAASIAAMGAIEAAGDIGGTALDEVEAAVTGTIDGVRIAPRAPFD